MARTPEVVQRYLSQLVTQYLVRYVAFILGALSAAQSPAARTLPRQHSDGLGFYEAVSLKSVLNQKKNTRSLRSADEVLLPRECYNSRYVEIEDGRYAIPRPPWTHSSSREESTGSHNTTGLST